MRRLIISLALCLPACGDGTSAPDDGAADAGAGGGGGAGGDGTTVTWTVHTNAECSTAVDTVTVDSTLACNVTGDASVSNVVCHDDRITFTNHPNLADCSSGGVENSLTVGQCQEFPGPFPTWKLIDPATYDCLSANL